MKEKEMLKKMYEQNHKSTALEMSADEILSENLSRGARVKNRGFAGAAVAAAAVLAVGAGVIALNNGSIETCSGESTPAVSGEGISSADAQNNNRSYYQIVPADSLPEEIFDGARIPGEDENAPAGGEKSADSADSNDTTTTTVTKTVRADVKDTAHAMTSTSSAELPEEAQPTTTTVTWDPKDEYSADEIKPISGEVNLVLDEGKATVRFTRSISKEFPQADMTFWLIPGYMQQIKSLYYEYKDGEIKPAENMTIENDPSQLTGGTWMSIVFKNKDGEVIYIEGVDINEQKAYVRLTDGAEECVTGKVFYFDQSSEIYNMLWKIWDFYYDIYENTDSLPG